MATVSETLELFEKALDIRTAVEPKQASVVTQLENFVNGGYKSPGAAATLEKIKGERDAYRQQYQTLHINAQVAAGDAFDTLSGSQKAQVNATSTIRLYNDVGAKIGSNNTAITELLAKANELLAKQKTQDSSTTNANVNTQTPAPAPKGDPQNPKQLQGSADEDNGKQQENPAGSNGGPTSAPNSSTDGTNGTTSGSGESTEESDASGTETSAAKPGKRLKNPLGYFSSYNYQLSLYMITPDAYNAFIASGRKQINALGAAGGGDGGVYLIAQSGGINNDSSVRAPGFQFDYGIDNLQIVTTTNAKANETASNATELKFQIIEPYGFSFITKLKQANDALAEYAKSMGQGWPENPSKQFFILGVRFLGYDEAGNRITGSEVYDGNTLDPNANGNGLFNTYYDIIINEIKFKIDGKATVYNIGCTSLPPQSAFSVKRGLITSNKEVTAATVDEAITQLFDKLNQDQIKLKEDGKIGEVNTYQIRYLGEPAREIAEAKLVSPEDIDKFKWPGAGAKTTKQSTAASEVKSQPDNTKRSITFSGSPATPILQAINNIVAQSGFLRDALNVVYTTSLETDPKKKSAKENKPDTKKTIKWYNCSAEISDAKWDGKVNDWAYTITYVLQTYETPVIDSAYANPGKSYYGPHKRYEYWYTGKNSEVLQYEQNLDTAYFNVVLGGDPSTSTSGAGDKTGGNNAGTSQTAQNGAGNASDGPNSVSRAPNQFTSQPRIGKLGAGLEAQNNYLTSLYDPGSFATAKITILGDPDFLVQDSASSENQVYSRFYGTDGFTINPNGGQVFIEIDFKEAVDYTSNTGTLNINESILFWKYPENISKQVKGVSFTVINVTSTFAGGKFTQLLETNINDFGDASKSQTGGEREDPNASTSPSASGPAPSNSQTTTQGTGLKKDNPSNQTQPATPTTSPAPTPQPNTTPTGSGAKPVADDDGG
jgi:hypothetical protein